MFEKIHYIQLAVGQRLKHIRIYSLGFSTCMVGKGFSLIYQRRLEPSENFAIKPCNPTNFFGVPSDLKGVTKLYVVLEFSCVQMWWDHIS
jgi:hypothetical protein